MASEALQRIETLIAVGLRLARTARSGRIALARIADSIELEWIPRPWGKEIVEELRAAHDAALEPIGFKDVERILRSAWGAKPSDELDELQREPVAVTPGAQVHRGVLDGGDVAVKVIRPGLASSVRQDLVLLEGLLAPLSAAFPALDAGAVLSEVRERILEELDLEHESEVMRRFHRALRGHPFLVVPAPVTRLAHQDVLVSEWIDGVPIAQAGDLGQTATRLLAFALGAGPALGIVHADLVPDNLLVLDDGRLAILDFGATRTIKADRPSLLADAVEAFIADDAGRLGTALEQLGALPAEHAGAALELVRHVLGELGGTERSRLDSGAVIAARDRLVGRYRDLLRLIAVGGLPAEDLWPARGHATAYATIARFGATGRWAEQTLRPLKDGWGA